jgi:hypothetical protein
MSANDPKRTSSSSLASWGRQNPGLWPKCYSPKWSITLVCDKRAQTRAGGLHGHSHNRDHFTFKPCMNMPATAGCCIAIQLCEP